MFPILRLQDCYSILFLYYWNRIWTSFHNEESYKTIHWQRQKQHKCTTFESRIHAAEIILRRQYISRIPPTIHDIWHTPLLRVCWICGCYARPCFDGSYIFPVFREQGQVFRAERLSIESPRFSAGSRRAAAVVGKMKHLKQRECHAGLAI